MKKLYFLLFLSISLIGVSQGVDQQKVDYVHSVANNIGWPEEKDEYVIKVITEDRSLAGAFREMAASRQINGKPIKVSFSGYVSIPTRLDILYVSQDYNGSLQGIIDRITGKPILIVTEESSDQEYLMMNLITTGAGVQFEFNRANIVNQNLTVKNGINDLGGKEVNVAALYRQARDSARALEARSREAKDQIENLNVNSAILLGIAKNQQDAIDQAKKLLDSLTMALNKLDTEILAKEDSLKNVEGRLAEREKEVEDINEEIVDQQRRLGRLYDQVDAQNFTLAVLSAFALFLVLAVILAYRAYQARRRDAKKLNEQKAELKILLEELQSTQNQLIQSEKMASLGTLTAGIAHEINNAINYVYSGIHVLNGKFTEMKPLMAHIKDLDENAGDLQVKVKEIVDQRNEIEYDSYETVMDTMINSIQVGAERTISVVKGLRTFSRGQEESMDEINVHEDIDVALLLLKNKMRPTLTIEKDLVDELPTMHGYPGQVGQAILNIIGNAMDACGNQPDSVVTIKTGVKEDKVTISIKDNGSGIKKEDLDKIFDPFYTTKKIGEGSGLGLSITYGIIEKHNGTIDVNSTVGEGTEFKIELPLNIQPLN